MGRRHERGSVADAVASAAATTATIDFFVVVVVVVVFLLALQPLFLFRRCNK